MFSTEKSAIELELFNKCKLPYQQLIKFYGIKYECANLIKLAKLLTVVEWKTKLVSKETIIKLNIKCNSPKLSKVLIACGLSNDVISTLLSANVKEQLNNENKITKIREDKLSCLDQGNSIYYKSCQSTDINSRSGILIKEENDINGDLPHMGKSLFLWTIGEPMSINGEGFISRAKLRICFENDVVVGLFIDKIYGNAELLKDNIDELHEWWNLYCYSNYKKITPIFKKSIKFNNISLKSPSASSGYQDSFVNLISTNNYEIIDTMRSNNLCFDAYISRTKTGGVYEQFVKNVKYNPQNATICIEQDLVNKQKVTLSEKQKEDLEWFIKNIGKPQSVKGNNNFLSFNFKNKQITIERDFRTTYIYVSDNNFNNILLTRNSECLKVYIDFEEFAKPLSLPYEYYRFEKVLIVTYNLEEYGFFVAEDIKTNATI